MKYMVQMRRTGYSFREIEVEATTEEEAIAKAHDEAGNYEYTEKSSEYDVEFVAPKKD